MSENPEELTAWTDALAEALGVQEEVPIAALLELTRDVAHQVVRPAGPITTYLIGRAVAQGTPLDEATAIVRSRISGHA